MIKIDKADVYGFEAAIRGMRNAFDSWSKSDSKFGTEVKIGNNDLVLMSNLICGGSDHSKFMRMVTVTMDITAPLYWWKQFDTYKVGTVANSCSTMHTITNRELTEADFSTDGMDIGYLGALHDVIEYINEYIQWYNNSHITGVEKKIIFRNIIGLLPSSYNQKRTVCLNYAVLYRIYNSRKNHKLTEWNDFCRTILNLPYMAELLRAGDER